MICAAGEDPQALILTLFIKVNITVTLHTLKSLALVSGNAQPVHVLLGPAGRIAIFFVLLIFFLLCSTGGPANLCDSVATECLSAAGCTALQQLSPHPTARSMPPCGSLQTAPPLPTPPTHPPGLHAQSSSFRTGPPVLNLLLLLRQSLFSATSDSSLALSLSCKDHFIQRWRHFSRVLVLFSWILLWICHCAFLLYCCHDVC